MFCEKCGKEIKNGAKFCAYCGAAQTGKTMPRVQAVSQPVKQAGADYGAKSKKSKAPLLVGIGAVAIAAAGYFVGIPMLHHHQWKTNMQAAAECLANEDYSGALQALEAADEAEADRQETALQFARAYAGRGNIDKAKEYLQKISDDVVENYPQEINSEYFANKWMPKRMYENPKQLLLGKYDYVNSPEMENPEYIKILSYSEPDKDTYRITCWSYDTDGKNDGTEWYTYDKEWKLIESDYTYWKNKYYYDENGELEEIDWCDEDRVTYKEEYKDGNCTQKTGYNEDNSISYIEKLEYDENGNQISDIYYDADGNMNAGLTSTIKADYDEHGNCTAEVCVGNGENYTNSYIYTYDEHGNVLTSEEYSEGVYQGRLVYEYDENGNKKTKTRENETGKISNKNTYNVNGILTERNYYGEDGNIYEKDTWTHKNGYLEEEYDMFFNKYADYSSIYYYTTLDLLKATMVE